MMGNNAPQDGLRQFRISSNDSTTSYTRLVSAGMSSPGRKYPFVHAISSPTGTHFLQMSTNFTDGHNLIGWLGTLPTWNEAHTTAADFVDVPIAVAGGSAFTEVRFGYSRYGGLPGDFRCTARQEACNSRSNISSIPLNFISESRSNQSCSSGCTGHVQAVSPNLMSYQIFTSPDGTTWTAS